MDMYAVPKAGTMDMQEELPSNISTDDEGDGSYRDEDVEGLDPEGYLGPPQKVVKPLTPEDLALYNAAQERAGIIYISRIPPGMRPAKVRHLMSAYGEVGKVYLQQEGVYITKCLNG
jgi:ESF2/ABP1 family protein